MLSQEVTFLSDGLALSELVDGGLDVAVVVFEGLMLLKFELSQSFKSKVELCLLRSFLFGKRKTTLILEETKVSTSLRNMSWS